MPEATHKYTNELANEKSPYLLQHAHNPVQWRAWNDAAFEAARREDKPIFLSIGYATCHWCHVMEHESFEDEGVANILNDHYIAIKLDREERPDIDAAYMEVCQAMTGRGGWPLTIIMMPDKKPFFSGTYFPKRSSHGRAGLVDILEKIAGLWAHERSKIVESSAYIYNTLQQRAEEDFYAEFSPEILSSTVDIFRQNYDDVFGGFRQSPKFPSPHQLCFLLRRYAQTHDETILEMVTTTLTKMRMGGIFDHVGFGFHRYSTDERWFLPHFEKMLYDQAWLTIAYTEAYQVTRNPLFRQTAGEILEYVDECLTSPEGAFYSAEDADSEGVEGKFYVWKYKEILEVLGADDTLIFSEIYGIDESGNFHDEATGAPVTDNIPHLKISLAEYAESHSYELQWLENKLQVMRVTLWKKRLKRIRPLLDDKILTDWNGMMIAALAKAAAAFQEPKYVARAERAWQFIQSKMITSSGELLHRYRDSEASIHGFLDDYAALAFGLFELYQATGEQEYLIHSTKLMELLLEKFEDEKGGLYQTEILREATPFSRQKQVYDGAIPSGNSMAVVTMMKLGTLLQHKEMTASALRALHAFGKQINSYSAGFTWLLTALDFYVGKRSEVVLQGDRSTPEMQVLTAMLQQAFLPNAVLMYDATSARTIELSREDKQAHSGLTPSVMICEDYHCRLPLRTPEALQEYVDSLR